MSNETAAQLATEFGTAARAARADLEEATTRVQQRSPLDVEYDATDRLAIMQQAVDAAEAADAALTVYTAMWQAATAMVSDDMDDATTRLWLAHHLSGLMLLGRTSNVASWASRDILMEGIKR